MAKNVLIPALEERLRGFIEVTRRKLREQELGKVERRYPTVTLAREFGCEGYPVAQRLQSLLEKRSGQHWVVMDRALLEEVARNNQLSEDILHEAGNRSRLIDDILSTFSSRWQSDKDYFRLLVRQIAAFAQEGNVILVGRGAPIVTQAIGNCYHFRIVAPLHFRVQSISNRMGISPEQAQDIVVTSQRQREKFLKDFLGRDVAEPTLYHLVFNNARFSADRIAWMMAETVMPAEAAPVVTASSTLP
jgi:cytidylate kinase